MEILDILSNESWMYDYDFYKDFKKSKYFDCLIDTYHNLNTKILYQSKIHGQAHIERVIFFCLVLSYKYQLSKKDTDILRYAASLHDTQRVDDSYDTEHGYRASIKSINYAPIAKDEKEILKAVLASHSRPDKLMDSTINEFDVDNFQRAKKLARFFKDADGLDRVRIGDLKSEFLRNSFSKDLISFAKRLFDSYKKNQ